MATDRQRADELSNELRSTREKLKTNPRYGLLYAQQYAEWYYRDRLGAKDTSTRVRLRAELEDMQAHPPTPPSDVPVNHREAFTREYLRLVRDMLGSLGASQA